MDRKRNSERQEPVERPIEPEMPKGLEEEKSDRPASEPPKEKRGEEL